MQVIESGGSPVERLGLGTDGRILAVDGRTIRFWDTATGQPSGTWAGRWGDYGLTFNPSGRWLYRAGGFAGLKTRDLRTGSVHADPLGRRRQGGSAVGVAVTPDGRTLVVAYCITNQVVGMTQPDDRPPKVAWTRPVAGPGSGPAAWVHSPVLHPDGTWFAAVERFAKAGTRVAIRDGSSGELLEAFGSPCRGTGPLALSPDGRWLLLLGGQVIYAWDRAAAARRPAKVTNPTRRYFTGLAFHPSGKYLAATSNDTTVKLYDTATWQLARTFTWNIGKLRSVAFSPDGTRAAVGSDTGQVVVWDVDL